jgi:hypothetical protein
MRGLAEKAKEYEKVGVISGPRDWLIPRSSSQCRNMSES